MLTVLSASQQVSCGTGQMESLWNRNCERWGHTPSIALKRFWFSLSWRMAEVLPSVLRCQLTYQGQVVTNAEARFSKSLRPRKPEGSLGRTAQDGHLDSHTAPEL